MKRTENSQNFFYIKQLLCLNQVCRLKRVVELNGLELSEKEIYDELKSELHELRLNFVMPSLTIKADHSVVNLTHAFNRLLESKLNLAEGYKPSIEDAVKYAPNLEQMSQEYKKAFEENGEVSPVRADTMTLINFSDGLFDELYRYIEDKESKLTLEAAIGYVNILAAVEFFFSLSEMGKKGFEPEEETEDNPWVD